MLKGKTVPWATLASNGLHIVFLGVLVWKPPVHSGGPSSHDHAMFAPFICAPKGFFGQGCGPLLLGQILRCPFELANICWQYWRLDLR